MPMARAHGHLIAANDAEEAEAVALAIALSLNDEGPTSRPPPASQQQRQQQRPWPAYPAPAVHPSVPGSQQHGSPAAPMQPSAAAGQGLPAAAAPRPPSAPSPPPPSAPPAPHASAHGGSGSSSSSSAGGGVLSSAGALGAKAGALLKQLLPSCAGCGGTLHLMPYVKALGAQWHPHCFRCAGCGQPLDVTGGTSFAVGEDQTPFHPRCHRELHHPRCHVCKGFIPSAADGSVQWREHAFWKQPHCPEHTHDGTPQCCSCNRLQAHGEGGVVLGDGRRLCQDCLETVVVDTQDCQPLYDEVLAFFRYMGMALPLKPPLLLVEGPVLNEYSAREGVGRGEGPVFHVRGLTLAEVYRSISSVVAAAAPGAPRGRGLPAVTSVPYALGAERCSVTCVLVLYGLPRLLMGSIVAHELLHAYLRMRHVAGLQDQIEEGLAQLMALLWLDSQQQQASDGPFAARLASYLGYQIRTDPSATYGDGFRIAYERFQQRGLKALVEHVVAHRAWPDWHA